MRKEYFLKSGVFLGILACFFVFGILAAHGANSLPPRTVLIAENTAAVSVVETEEAAPVVAEEPVAAEDAAVEAPAAAPAANAAVACNCEACSGCYESYEYVPGGIFGDGLGFGFFGGGFGGFSDPYYGSRLKIGGHIETGIYANGKGNKTKFDADGKIPTSGNSDRLGKLQSTGWQVQQAWLYAERALSEDRCGFDWGFRIDGLFGTDAYAMQSWGDGSFDGSWKNRGEYGFAIPQMYIELAYNRLSVKLGKFMTPIGYEAVPATEMLFYSHSYMYDREPGTHTGALFTFAYDENLSIFAGVTTGQDTGWGNNYKDTGFLAGFEAQLTTKLRMGYGFMWNKVHGSDDRPYTPAMWDSPIVSAGRPTAFLRDGQTGDESLHSLVFTWNLTDRMTIGLQGNYGKTTKTNGRTNDKQTMYEQFGTAVYLDYQLACNLSADFRGEWFRQNATMVGNQSVWGHQNCYEITAALNYSPFDWLTIRPEIRYDAVYGENRNVFDGGTKNTQLSGGVGAIIKF